MVDKKNAWADKLEYEKKLKESIENEEREHNDVFRPKHYMGQTIEWWTFSFVNDLPGFEHSVLTYIGRWRKKNRLQDLEKAKRVIEMRIELEKNRSDYVPKKGCL